MNTKKYKKINFILIIICICLLLLSPNTVFAGEVEGAGDAVPDIKTTELQPTDDQFLELRAVEINEVEGQNRQVIMELWGNQLEFKRI